MGILLRILAPQREHRFVSCDLVEDFLPLRHHLRAPALGACTFECFPQRGDVAAVTPGSPEQMYVVEVARAGVGYASRDGGLELLGEHRLEWVGHQADASPVEQERVVVDDGAGRDAVARGNVDLERHCHGRIHRLEEHAYARVVVGLPDILGAVELEGPIIVDADSRHLAENLLGGFMRQRKAGDRRVEVHRGPGRHAHEGGDEHATLDDDVVAPF